MAGAYPIITSYPPIEQLSVVSADQCEVSFTVNIKWSVCRPRYPFQLCLCAADIGSQKHVSAWRAFPLSKSRLSTIAFEEDDEWYSENYEVTLSRPALTENSSSHQLFTIKYRISDETAWQWITGPSGVLKGEIMFQGFLSAHPDVGTLIALAPNWHAVRTETTHRDTSLFSLQSAPIDGFQQLVLGRVLDQARYFALSRIEPPWIAPRHGGDFIYLAERTILCSVLREDGNVVTVAAPCVGDVYSFLMSNEKGELTVHVRDDREAGQSCRILISIASDLETSISAIMRDVRAEANESRLVREMIDQEFKSDSTDSSHLAPLVDYLGFCTWNALGPDLTHEKILNALRLLRKNGVKISTLLVDDNWQTLGGTALGDDHHDYRGFADFKANEGFPSGLKGLTSSVKAENPFITDIGVWHGLMGYWGGLAKEGWIVDNYGTVDVDGKMYYAVPTKLKSISASDLNRFYDDFYAYLSSCGISFVKTDAQCLIGDLTHGSDRAELIPAYQAAWTMAYQRRLGGRAISCMSQIPELLWQSLLQTKTAPVIFRNSDDFFPEIPSSHPWHIWANAHNALFTQHLNAVLDWDMFQTSMDFGPAHAASRCLSGGPIFITDVPGEHDLDLIDQMVAPSPDGMRSLVLRPVAGAKTPRAFDRYQESGVLKIVAETVTGVKFMGLFNTRATRVGALVSVSEFPGIGTSRWKPDSEVIFFSHRSQTVRGPVRLESNPGVHSNLTPLIEVDLDFKGFEILSAYEVRRLSYGGEDFLVAVLGLLGKMTGAAAICSLDISCGGGGIKILVALKALGKLGIWLSGQTMGIQNIKANLQGMGIDQGSITLTPCPHAGETSQVLQLDLAWEWIERSQVSTSQQVTLEVIIAP